MLMVDIASQLWCVFQLSRHSNSVPPGSHHEPVELAQFLKLCYSRLRPSQVTPTRHTCAPEQETGWASRAGIMCSQSAHVYNGPVLGVRLCCHHLELLPRFLTKLPYYIGPSKLHSLSKLKASESWKPWSQFNFSLSLISLRYRDNSNSRPNVVFSQYLALFLKAKANRLNDFRDGNRCYILFWVRKQQSLLWVWFPVNLSLAFLFLHGNSCKKAHTL